jgi:hypothetical protein
MSEAEALAQRLSPKPVRSGRGWLVPCVAHDDSKPSLHISQGESGKPLLHCFAGCDGRDVIHALRRMGLWPAAESTGERSPVRGHNRPTGAEVRTSGQVSPRESRDYCRQLWRQASQSGPVLDAYLRSRGLAVTVPPSIRLHPALLHKPSGQRLPAMLAAVQGPDGAIPGLHRTYLRADGSGKADVEPAKMMLGSCAGGAVRLSAAGEALQVAEGIETALALLQATGQPTWAALSTAGLTALALPSCVRSVVICADHDANGAGQRAAEQAAQRWIAEGRTVRIALPPQPGRDFADVLAGQALVTGAAA